MLPALWFAMVSSELREIILAGLNEDLARRRQANHRQVAKGGGKWTGVQRCWKLTLRAFAGQKVTPKYPASKSATRSNCRANVSQAVPTDRKLA